MALCSLACAGVCEQFSGSQSMAIGTWEQSKPLAGLVREWAKRRLDRWDTESEISGFKTSEVGLSGAMASPRGGRNSVLAKSQDREQHLN